MQNFMGSFIKFFLGSCVGKRGICLANSTKISYEEIGPILRIVPYHNEDMVDNNNFSNPS